MALPSGVAGYGLGGSRDAPSRSPCVREGHSLGWAVAVETYRFEDDGGIPNSPLPVLVFHDVEAARDASTCEALFARHGWLGAWRDGIFSFHHFHSTAH